MTRLVVVLLLAAASTGCSSPDETLVVGAAASLTDAFTEIAAAFDSTGATLELNFAGSSSLREQILGGAPIDVFASANIDVMQELVSSGDVEAYAVFARNSLVIAVPEGNPAQITGLDDFSRDDLLLGLCASEVPCGSFARESLAKAGVEWVVDTEEPDVRALLTKVAAGELDAGIVYRTDVIGADVEGVEIPDALNVEARYTIAVTDPSVPQAADFVDFVLSPAGLAILRTNGFEAP